MLIKVCGLLEGENINEVCQLGIQMIGLNFYKPSKRYLGEDKVELFHGVPNSIDKAGVFVNEDIDNLLRISEHYALEYVQLHGDETPEYCQKAYLNIKVIKAFGVTDEDNLNEITMHYDDVDIFLFDTKTKLYGGSGKKFDWSVLDSYNGDIPFLLSGGIGPDDYLEIQSIRHPSFLGVDVNSKFELSPGVKNVEQLEYFIQKIKTR